MSLVVPAAGGTKSLTGGVFTNTVNDFQTVAAVLPAASEAVIRYSSPFGFPIVRKRELRFPRLRLPPSRFWNGTIIMVAEFVFLYSSCGSSKLAISEGFTIWA